MRAMILVHEREGGRVIRLVWSRKLSPADHKAAAGVESDPGWLLNPRMKNGYIQISYTIKG